jgi:carbonic anhydrase
MFHRRSTCRVALLLLLGLAPLALGCASTQPLPASAATPSTDVHAPSAPTPQAAFERLRDGNARFVSGRLQSRDVRGEVATTSAGQKPFAAVLGCMDSRVPPETVFDQRLGDLFVVRVAGNVVNADELGSLEYATEVVGTPLILVLGHTACGAVKGACDHVELGNLTGLLQRIAPAVAASAAVPGEHTSKNHDFVDAVTIANVRQSMRELVEQSPVLKARVERGALAVRGGVYDLATGKVTFLDEH